MIITGALYGGHPKAGSYREVKVLPDRIVTRVRDFAKPAGTWEQEKVIAPPPPGQIPGRIAVDGDMIYYGAGSTVYARRAKNGQPLWQATVNGTIVTGLTAGDGKVFVPAGEHSLYCLDARNGEVQWRYAVGLPILTEPVVSDGKVFFGAMDGYFRALDVATGTEVWKHQSSAQQDRYTSAPLWPAVLTGDKVIVAKRPAGRNQDRNLVAFNQADGKVIWSRRVNPGWAARIALNSNGDKLYAP
ncbi:MAG: PQQ-binding-like beta-propeller repeat protein [Planctomycetota bacterium]|nr:PQQ-binding-like beta-propeller repeat protein [Planctomycetota bacterium]